MVEPLTDAEARRVAEEIARSDYEALAITGLFSFLEPAHERRLREASSGGDWVHGSGRHPSGRDSRGANRAAASA